MYSTRKHRGVGDRAMRTLTKSEAFHILTYVMTKEQVRGLIMECVNHQSSITSKCPVCEGIAKKLYVK